MTRIIAGAAKGHRLAVPAGTTRPTRPTSDRAREALFSSLDARLEWKGARVLDLYAGSGAVGLEALSRGAASVTLVESSGRAAAVIRRNIAELALRGAELITDRVERLVARRAPQSYDLLFADPPYALRAVELAEVLASAARNGWVDADSLVVVERASRDDEWVWPAPFEGSAARRYGEAMLWYGRHL